LLQSSDERGVRCRTLFGVGVGISVGVKVMGGVLTVQRRRRLLST
jgi:hypothetical protein